MSDRSETPRKYYDTEGHETTLFRLVREEPDWAVNQIKHRDSLERELQAANARVEELESCPECGHPVSEHCDSRVVGCQHGNGTEKNPLCGCRILTDEMLAVRHFRGLYDKELATLRTQLSEAKAKLESVKNSAKMGMAAAHRIGSISLAEAQRIQATLKPETLESEREMNRILTEELEEAKVEVETWKGQAQWEKEEAERVSAIRLRQAEEIERLHKGEYICQKCGLRKDAEFEKGDF